MTASVRRPAICGGTPAFDQVQHVAQINLSSWESTEKAFQGIFERHFFANHGPLVQQLDRAFASENKVGHAIAVTNGTMALMLMAKSLGLDGEVIVPAFTFPATVQALHWAGLTPVFCDVNADSHMLSADLAGALITERTCSVLGVHLWGRACDPENLQRLCDDNGLALIFDACHAAGCLHAGRSLGSYGLAAAYSFHATKVLNGSEGGAIVTSDDALANRLLTMRSFHAGQSFAEVPLRFNAKMSEAQAALTLLSLDELSSNIENNRQRYNRYQAQLEAIPGLALTTYVEPNNFQYIVIETDANAFGLNRDQLAAALSRENILTRRYFDPGAHRIPPFGQQPMDLPVTEHLCASLLQLPNGQSLSLEGVDRICDAIHSIHSDCANVRKKLDG